MKTKSIIPINRKFLLKVLFLVTPLFGSNLDIVAQCAADFSIYPYGKSFIFENYDPSTSIKYLWDFGDGTTSKLKTPIHLFSKPITYKVCLLVEDTLTNCKDTYCRSLVNCDARFSFKVFGKNVEAQAYAGSYRWDFGDGERSPGGPISHTYKIPGIYNFCHITQCGTTDSNKTCYTIDNRCVAKFEYKADSSDPLKIIFTNKSTGNATAGYTWYFGDGSNSWDSVASQINPSHKYSKVGYYNIGLLRQEDNSTNCRDSIGQIIIVGNPPCDTTFKIYLDNNHNNAIVYELPHNWENLKVDFGDGASTNYQGGAHFYKKGGTYILCMSYVCYTRDTIKIYRKVNIPPQDSCLDLNLLIDSLSQMNCIDTLAYARVHAQNGLAPYTYVWNTSTPIIDSIARFSETGIYYITVTDANKCRRSKSIFIHVAVKKNVDIRANLRSSLLRPGVKGIFDIKVANDGCSPANGRVYIVLSQLLTYQSAYPAPNNIVGDTIFWNYSSLIYGLKTFIASIYFTTKTTTTAKDTIDITISAKADEIETNYNNNYKIYRLNINNSKDPNIKSVYPYGACTERYVDKNKPLIYTVQFQNTGNAEAINISILDISSKFFDINTLKVIGQSHPNLVLEVFDSNNVKFRFDKINLPDSFSDEKNSHGYVIYEIAPKSILPNGTLVGGKAQIYFDYNFPVSTNIVTNKVTDKVPECFNIVSYRNVLKKNVLKFYPNPTNGTLNLEISNITSGNTDISIINILGVPVFKEITQDNNLSIDIGFLPPGIYLIRVKSGGEIMSRTIVKK